MKNTLTILALYLFSIWIQSEEIYAQQSDIDINSYADFNHALKLFNSKSYAAAQNYFREVAERTKNNTNLKADAHYYDAICAIRLNLKDADKQVLSFVNDYPNSNKKDKAYFNVGNYYFANKKSAHALKWYSKVDAYTLSESNKNELNFKMGYAFLTTRNLDLAKSKFITLINDPKYGNDSRYYFGYISYKQEDYEIAEKTLEEIADDQAYKSEVTYYLLDISFKSGKFKKCIEVGKKLLKDAKPKEASEISKIIGESYFNLKQYQESISYLEAYKGRKGKWNNTDFYQLGYAYFKQKNFEKSVNNFNKIIDERNNVSQKAYYNLGECYIYLNKKPEALNAFKSASEMSFDLTIREDAALNYAKLSYEEGNPYKSVTLVLREFLEKYPKSSSYEEINELLVTSYLYQQDYQGALNFLKNKKSKQNQNLTNEISYYRAIQLFNLNKFQEALPYFENAKKSIDNTIKVMAHYWNGEANYRLKNFQSSILEFGEFKKVAPSESHELKLIDYQIGYSYFKLEEYSSAALAFQNFIETKINNTSLSDDAIIRLGDCFFATRDYAKAIKNYKIIVDQMATSADYAQYQMAMSYGFLNENKDKIRELERLLINFEISIFRDDALFQLGNTFSAQKDPKNAHRAYRKLLQDYPKSSYTTRALLRDGLLYFNENENRKALKNYQEIVSKFPNSAEAKEAVTNAKNVYIDMGAVDEYASWVKGISFVNITDAELDDSSYKAAENKYISGNFPKAIEGFRKYIESFAEGLHILPAHFYLAKLLQKEKSKDAEVHYQYVVDQPQSEYSEEALNKLSQILLEKEDWTSAIPLLERLELEANLTLNILFAQSNLMKGYYQSQEYRKAVEYAEKVLLQEKLEATIEYDAKIIIARSAFQTDDDVKAEEFYTEVERNASGELKAEALYYLAFFANKKKEYEASNEIIQTITSDFSAYKYWGAKSFVIMAKNYYALENSDPYQATYILENIIKNFPQFEEIVNDAKNELKKIKLNEAKTNNSIKTPKK